MKPIGWVMMLFFISFGIDVAASWAADPEPAEEKPFVYDDQGKRDPFLRLVTPGGAIVNYDKDVTVTDMVLEGIIAGEDHKNIAIINGIILQTGDKIGLYEIKDINVSSVIIQKGEERYSLKLKKEE
jgi:hypothetical protein